MLEPGYPPTQIEPIGPKGSPIGDVQFTKFGTWEAWSTETGRSSQFASKPDAIAWLRSQVR